MYLTVSCQILKFALQFALLVDLGNDVCERELTKAIQ